MGQGSGTKNQEKMMHGAVTSIFTILVAPAAVPKKLQMQIRRVNSTAASVNSGFKVAFL